jgi:hypothetical protein
MQATFPWWQDLTVSGVWRALRQLGLGLRSAQVQQDRPDPDYRAKEARLLACLREAAATPDEVVALFLDEMGYTRWPDPAADWGPLAPAPRPLADRAGTKQPLWRVIGALNALLYARAYVRAHGSMQCMAREKATITLDRDKVARVASLVGGRSMSEVVDIALDRLIQAEELRRDVAAYARQPLSDEELAVTDLPVELDLADDDVDYEALYGKQE